MNTILRAGLGALLAATLLVGPALAIEDAEIFRMTAEGATEEEIVRLLVEDGRGFELTASELEDLRAAGVSDFVVDVMQDPELGRRWLAGEEVQPDDGGGVPYDDGGGYSTTLDDAYNQGYVDGQKSTALVYSFGYYYGPLARYYYTDPFYFSFWWGGYSAAYWPSYYAYYYRPAYSWCYSYPYNYYTYDSYYCHTYYDPGYWVANGYTVQPGYGRTVWDDGPRWRDGGLAPVKGGRPDAASALAGTMRDGTGTRMRNPGGPPAIREALASRDRGTTRSPLADLGTPKTRTPGSRTVGDVVRGVGSRSGARVERGTVARGDSPTRMRNGMRDVSKGRVVRTSPDGVERSQRVTAGRSTVRRETPRQIASRSQVSPRTRAHERWVSRSEDRIASRSQSPDRVNVIRGNRQTAPREAAPRMDRRSGVSDRVRIVRGNGSGYEGGRRMVARGNDSSPRGRFNAPRSEAPVYDSGPRQEAAPDHGRGGGHGRVESAPPPRQESAPAPRQEAARHDGGGRGHGGDGVGRVMGAVGRGR